MKIRNGSSPQSVSFQTFAVGVGSSTSEVAIVRFILLVELGVRTLYIHSFSVLPSVLIVILIYDMQLQSNFDRANQYRYT